MNENDVDSLWDDPDSFWLFFLIWAICNEWDLTPPYNSDSENTESK